MEKVTTNNEISVSIHHIGVCDIYYADASAMTVTRASNGEVVDGCGGGGAEVFKTLEDATRWAIEWIDNHKEDGDETSIHYLEGQVIERDFYEELMRRPEAKSPF